MSGAVEYRLRDAQKALTRRRLLDAGRELFRTRGYGLVTIDDVATVAGTSRATFYLHFKSKLELLIEVRAEVLPKMAEFYRALDITLATGSRSAVRDGVECCLAWFEENGDLVPAWDEAAASERAFRAELHGVYDRLVDEMPLYIARWSDEELPRARLLLQMLILQVERVFLRWMIQDNMGRPQREVVAESLVEIWSAALGTGGSGIR